MEVSSISGVQNVPQMETVKEVKVAHKVDMSDPVDIAELNVGTDAEATSAENKKSKKKLDWFAALFPTYSLIADGKYKTEAAFLGAETGLAAIYSHFVKQLPVKNKMDDIIIDSIVERKIPKASMKTKIGLGLTIGGALALEILHRAVANKVRLENEEETV